MSKPESISVLMPNYNHAGHLRVALTAVCEQTRPPDEVLVVDDGSNDDSVSVMEELAGRYPEIKIFQNKSNLGVSASVNRILAQARGDVIVCAAADDELLPTFMEETLGMFQRYPHTGICFSELVVRETDGSVKNYSRDLHELFGIRDLPEYMSTSNFRALFQDRYRSISSNTVMARRELLLMSGGFPSALEWHSDWFAFYCLALRYGACRVARGLSIIRSNPGGYSHVGMRCKRQRSVIRTLADILKSDSYRDLYPVFLQYPALLSVFGNDLLFTLGLTPRHWDLFLAYLGYMNQYTARMHSVSKTRAIGILIRKAPLRLYKELKRLRPVS